MEKASPWTFATTAHVDAKVGSRCVLATAAHGRADKASPVRLVQRHRARGVTAPVHLHPNLHF
jgi:hypothetical protein